VPTVDLRTVGEPLADSDALSRELLLDASPSHGRAMVRALGRLVQSAAQLWAVHPPTSLAGPSGPDLMVRLHGLGEYRSQRWALAGTRPQRSTPGRDCPQPVARTGAHRALWPGCAANSVEARADIAAARASIMHTLYVGAHATAVALREYAKDLRGRSTRGDPKAPAHRIAAGRSRNPGG
jgi:hypothetical protein